MHPFKITNQTGFTLIEVMIATGLTVILALAIASVMTTSAQQQAVLGAKQNAYTVIQEIQYEKKVAPPPAPGNP